MHTRNEVLERVIEAIADALTVQRGLLSESTLLQADLKADSMSVVSVAMSLDDEFDIEIDLRELPNADFTVGWVADYVYERLA